MLLTSLLFFAASPVTAYETDQFSNRLRPVADSREILNIKVNQTIREVADNWQGPRDDWKFVNQVYHSIGGHHWVDKLERWAMNAPEVEKLDTPRRRSIYSGHPIWATRVAALFGVGPTMQINGVLIGSDKIGHFLSQGRKFYRRYLRFNSESRAGEWSAYTERALFGQMSTGSYSNADLVANYEGYVFYRSLFEEGVIGDKPAILSWQGDKWLVQREFDWADHVNAYWDEALNINHYDSLLYEHMQTRLMTFCPDYRTQPASYTIRDEAALAKKYGHLQLRNTAELRLPNLCNEAASSQSNLATASSQP